MRSGLVDLGRTMIPSCSSKRRMTCPAFLPCFSAIAVMTGWVSSAELPCPSGPHASIFTLSLSRIARSAFCWKNGFHSTWLTAGRVSNCGTNVFQILGVMLLTPMDLILPAAFASSSAFHAPATSP